MSRLPSAALTASLAALVALAVQTQFLLLVVAAILVVQCLIASAPAPADERGRAVLSPQELPVLAAGVVSATLAYNPTLLLGARGTQSGSDGAVSTGVFAGVLLGVAAGLTVAIIGQLVRRDERVSLVRSLAAATSLVLFSAIATAWIGAARATSVSGTPVAVGRDIVTLACAAVVAGLIVWVFPVSRTLAGAAVLAVGAAAAAGTNWAIGGSVDLWFAAVAGMCAAAFAAIGLLVGHAWTQGRGHVAVGWGFPGALAFAIVGPLVHVAAQLASAQ